jgi:hypothetical protein
VVLVELMVPTQYLAQSLLLVVDAVATKLLLVKTVALVVVEAHTQIQEEMQALAQQAKVVMVVLVLVLLLALVVVAEPPLLVVFQMVEQIKAEQVVQELHHHTQDHLLPMQVAVAVWVI